MLLLKKALRAMWQNKRSYLACSALISVGAYILVAMGVSSEALAADMEEYYRNYRMADVFAQVRAAPLSAAEELLQIEGIQSVDARLTYDARAQMEGVDRVITLRLMSMPKSEASHNLYHKTRGFAPAQIDDIIVGEAFFSAHNLEIGDNLSLIVHGRQFNFNVTAAALSPEFVYAIQDMSQLFPDDFSFGYAYVDYQIMASMLNMQGFANDISFLLNYDTVFEDIEANLRTALERYGLIGLIPRENQLSHSMLYLQISSMQQITFSLSSVFILCSMVMLYLMLKRLIEQDRGQIGTLKAFGFTNGEILRHYLVYGLVAGIAGGLIGVVLGLLSIDMMMQMYSDFFHMPSAGLAQVALPMVALAILISAAGGTLAALAGASSAIGLHPAQAMRPEAPPVVKFDVLKALPFTKALLTSGGRMAVRSIGRNKVRSLFIVIGIMFAFGITAVMSSMVSMVDVMLFDQFNYARMYDARITFNRPLNENVALAELTAIEGVRYAESIFESPVILRNAHIREGALITGIPENSLLYGIFDINLREYAVPNRGQIVLSSSLANDLLAGVGERIYVDSPLLNAPRPVYVGQVVTGAIGGGAYMLGTSLLELFDESALSTAIIFTADSVAKVAAALQEGDNIAAIDDLIESQAAMMDMMAVYDVLLQTMWVIGVFVALAIIYNTSSISLSERKREYATLRVLGLDIKEVMQILSFEYWLLAIFGMLLGLPFARLLMLSLAGMIDDDLIAIPTTIVPMGYIMAFAAITIAIIITNLIAKRTIGKFSLVEVLKERE
jgi:putative ABC transport system permease protein